jgi:hypothetical protein
MLRTHRATLALAVVALVALGVACGTTSPTKALPPIPSPSPNKVLADVISPGLDHGYVFSHAGAPPVDFQKASTTLVGLIHRPDGLHVAALESTKSSAAVFLVEDDPNVPWGTLLRPALRTIFEQFAANRSMGDWLIVLDDVIVHRVADPVPLTAYRWSRAQVAQYVACGIPDEGQNDCSKTFYVQALTVILQKGSTTGHGS